MKTKNAALVLTDAVTATAAPAAAKAKPAPRAVTKQTQNVKQFAQVWHSLSGTDQSSWETLSQQIKNPAVNNVPARNSGYVTFVGHNTTVTNTGAPVMTTAPAVQVAPPLPPVTISAAFATSLTLTLNAPVAYPGKVLIYAAKPMLASRHVYTNTPFKLLGSIAFLGISTDISALFLARYRIASPGYKVALKLVGISAGGFRTTEMLVTGIIAHSPAK